MDTDTSKSTPHDAGKCPHHHTKSAGDHHSSHHHHHHSPDHHSHAAHAGIDKSKAMKNDWDPEMIANYSLMSYSIQPADIDYPKLTTQKAIDIAKQFGLDGKVLDVGCGPGGSTVHLARHFSSVVALDPEPGFIKVANTIKNSGSITFNLPNTSEETSDPDQPLQEDSEKIITIAIDKSIFTPDILNRITYIQTDATNIEESVSTNLHGFDLIFFGNVLHHVKTPKSLLLDMTERLIPGGLIFIVDMFHYHGGHTQEEEKIGGVTPDGTVRHPDAHLSEILVGFKKIYSQEFHHHHTNYLSVWKQDSSEISDGSN